MSSSLICFHFVFSLGNRYRFRFIHVNNQFSQHHILKMLYFLQHMILTPLTMITSDDLMCLGFFLYPQLCSIESHIWFLFQYHAAFCHFSFVL